MNKVYNTVWNESTGMWVVTSELTRKGGRRPRQIRRTALAGLIAGLLLPSAPALATYDENQTLESGGKSSSMRLSAGDTATNPTINNGHQYVSNGSSATGTTINSGGHQHVSNGGSATGTIINSGGHQYVNSSGSATGTTINSGGNQYVSSGGSATGTTINSSGYQHVSSGGSATSTTINSGGEQYVSSGGSATSTTINSGGYQYVSSGGSATGTTINSGGMLSIFGGSAVDITQKSGGGISTDTSATLSGTNINGSFSIAGGSASNMLLENGGYLAVLNGHQATSTTINSGGLQRVSSGGSATGTTINSGGNQYVNSSGSATGTTINGSGYQFVSSGGSATGTTINGSGYQYIFSGGSATSTTINSSGNQYVSSGGSATSTTINSGGNQNVYVNGNVTKTTITDGGILQVDAGGSASQVTQNSGGAIVANTSAVLSGTNGKGTFSIAGGSAVNMLLENGGLLTVLGGHDASDTTVGSDGTLSVQSGGVLRGTTTLTDKGTLVGDVVTNEGNLYFLNNSAATFAGTLTGTGTLTQEGGNTRFSGLLSQDGGITLQSGAAMTMDALQANANVTTQSGTTLTLDNGSILTGSVTGDNTGAGDMTVKGASVWHLGGDSTVGALTLDNGTVDFRPSATTGLTQAFRPVSLVSESLSGNGTFRMNTDIASHTGDMLNVTGNASGNFVLDIRNTGLEPVSAGTPLQVVHTGSGDAAFSLNGGKVDAGTWEYYLNKENTDWYLKADSSQPGTDNPVPPVRHTTKSADAVLDMATAPVYVFNSELQSLRFRHGDVMQNTRLPGGVWGRYTGSDTRINGGAGSGYSLTQSGMETGGDTVFDLNDSRLAVGAFVSYTDNSISHNRGGSSTVGSTGGGLYATWFNNDGYYVDGVVKVNRFRNELRTWMSDGTAVKGDYHQNGFGGSLEAGRTFSLNENTWIQPYLRSTAFRAESKDISLDNGMKAKAGTTKSLQGEVGVNLGMNLDVAGTVVRPYLTTAVSHEFSDNNKVRINDSYNFTNDISGTTGKYGAGVSAQLTANAGVWAEASYQNGENTESPVTGSVGFRINF
ncbi:autotransporter outer membrane beta-barrel domain-containing protein [Escherichia coli]|uniref:autotransporter outer membrane beta-barrel domain-containing protein n=1 Tax=Escherichia coli TaxID=562 RepID=UPI000DE9BC43|nr:autotransporter outer membrane beta-barrel domain-containing protein [Escherichia coli]RCB47065.1 autotransporter outer membrane beta-barrel domain-containing protein [Escherichia coli]